jgi:hypothetical protein
MDWRRNVLPEIVALFKIFPPNGTNVNAAMRRNYNYLMAHLGGTGRQIRVELLDRFGNLSLWMLSTECHDRVAGIMRPESFLLLAYAHIYIKQEHENLPSGKNIRRSFNVDGSLHQETHSYGIIDIAIQYTFKDTKKIEETYFAKRNLVSRKTYEKVRAAYSDMPPADNALKDWGAKLLKGMAEEKRLHRAEAEKHVPDPEKAGRSDDFCMSLMKRGKQSEVKDWIKNKKHTLGEMDWSGSKHLVDKLFLLGSVNVYACEIDSYEDDMENTGHLVIEGNRTADTQCEAKKNLKNC